MLSESISLSLNFAKRDLAPKEKKKMFDVRLKTDEREFTYRIRKIITYQKD